MAVRVGKAYPVGLVGEQHYQPVIGLCRAGEQVRILHEVGNPYDDNALVVATGAGLVIGYIGADCWLQDAIHDERNGCSATILEVRQGPQRLDVVIQVRLCAGPIGRCRYPVDDVF